MFKKQLTVVAVCLAVGLAGVAEQSFAKKKWKNDGESAGQLPFDHPAGKYPNGRPFRAIEYDFMRVFNHLDELSGDHNGLSGDHVELSVDHQDILDAIDGLEDAVDAMGSKLDVEVHVGPASGDGITLYVQVSHNGVGIEGLDEAAFDYDNSFPEAGDAVYCGVECFAPGAGGVYMIDLDVGDPGSYAGAVTVVTGEGEDEANGTDLVSFEVE